jgi:putative endonuclease
MFYTYVLRSKRDGKHYIGFTEDLERRLREHNDGLVKATEHRRPLELEYFEACLAKEDAIKREKYFKTGFGRRFIKERLKNYLCAHSSAG